MIDKHVSTAMWQSMFIIFVEQAKTHHWMEAAEVAGKGWAKDKGVYC